MKRILQLSLIAGVISLLGSMTSCEKDYLVPIVSELPDSASFSGNIIPIFDAHCNSSGCHNTGGIAPDLTKENAYNDLLLYSMVDTLNPESSILYARMATGKPMPPSGYLKGGEPELVLLWIQQGAKNN